MNDQSQSHNSISLNDKALRGLSSYLIDTLGVANLHLPVDQQIAVTNNLQGQLSKGLSSESAAKVAALEVDFFIDAKELFPLSTLNHKNNKVQYLVLHLKKDQSVFQNETRDVFAKMVQALKLPPQNLLVLEAMGARRSEELIDYLIHQLHSPMQILILSQSETKSDPLLKGRHTFYITHSPLDFVESPDLKKIAWSVMQKIRAQI